MNRMKMAAFGLIGLLALPGAAAADMAQFMSYTQAAKAAGSCEAQVFLGLPCVDMAARGQGLGAVAEMVGPAYGVVDFGIPALNAPQAKARLWVVDAGSQFGMDKRIIKKGILPEAVSYQIIPPVGWQNW